MPPRERKTVKDEPYRYGVSSGVSSGVSGTAAGGEVTAKVELKRDSSLFTELTALQKRIEARLDVEPDYNRKIALTKINASLEYGLALVGGKSWKK